MKAKWLVVVVVGGGEWSFKVKVLRGIDLQNCKAVM